MKRLEPYKDISEAKTSLDNGGRFYNILTKADDGVISQSELGKVAGLFSNKQTMILFLDLSISLLNENDKNQVISLLTDDLQSMYIEHTCVALLPSQANSIGKLSCNTIITGIPKKLESKSDFNGFIMIPIVTGKVTTFTMIPIIDTYDVYEVVEEGTTDTFIIAHAKGSHKLPEKKIQVAGVLKELKSKKDEKSASNKYLEAIYYVD
ncbi:hypothetical protein [Aquimarina sp. 2201CG14-23]|uniref:hypothetical protein n=1 Tax=Aquimarina mycalae TaxID=3040073 RepID=UPI002477E2F2|nr:hypothetical protein [Aquimarina sp. 2201CG14-23]MDH7445707.1 hypothetical protein [Aquimarina sp. 2201CG14-23]